ncbi:MAG: hypothetical protein ACTHMY_31440 [Solirubrobacteraceae bacterium]
MPQLVRPDGKEVSAERHQPQNGGVREPALDPPSTSLVSPSGPAKNTLAKPIRPRAAATKRNGASVRRADKERGDRSGDKGDHRDDRVNALVREVAVDHVAVEDPHQEDSQPQDPQHDAHRSTARCAMRDREEPAAAAIIRPVTSIVVLKIVADGWYTFRRDSTSTPGR